MEWKVRPEAEDIKAQKDKPLCNRNKQELGMEKEQRGET